MMLTPRSSGHIRSTMWRILCLFIFVVCDARSQLLDADQCVIGYQYRPAPELLTCRPNITVTRLSCWVAIPTVLPVGTRAEVVWYRRSLEEAESGSTTAFLVENAPPFTYVDTICNREQICPDALVNLTVHVNQLEISRFEPGLQGDYTCLIMLMNQTTDTAEQVMQPSACTRLKLDSEQTQNCQIIGQRSTWTCADMSHQFGECPQEFLVSTATSVVTPLLTSLSSTPPLTPNFSTSSLAILQTTTLITPSSTGDPIPSLTSTLPTPTDIIVTTAKEPSNELGTIYVTVGIIVLLLVVGIATTASIAIAIRMIRQKKVIKLKEGRESTYVISPGIYRDSPNLRGAADLKRNSTIYSKPTWPSTETSTLAQEHTYATIPGEPDGKLESDAYSYAYQHNLVHQSTKQADESSEKEHHRPYQQMGNIDYMQMYSKPSPLLLSTTEKSSGVMQREERGYTHLSTATVDQDSVYTIAGHKPEGVN